MKNFLPSFLVFFSTSLATAIIIILELDALLVHQVIAGLLLLFIFCLAALRTPILKKGFQEKGTWAALFFLTLMLQLLLVSTGSVLSKFFILFDLFILGISFFFTFATALIFVLFTLPLLGLAVLFNETLTQAVYSDPVTPILYLLSCFSIIPVSYLLADKYHFKSKISTMLQKQLDVEDTIIESLNELVIVTDSSFRILSVNDVVEQVLRKSRAELLNAPLLSVLFLKDKEGNLLTPEKLSLPLLLQERKNTVLEELRLVTTTVNPKKVTVKIHPIVDVDREDSQFSVIITEKDGERRTPHVHEDVQLALTKHRAMMESFKKILAGNGTEGVKTKLLLLEKTEEDIITTLLLEGLLSDQKKVKFDIAQLSKKTMELEEEFAAIFHVPLDFSFINFGKHEIEPIIAGQTDITYDDLTGPFFTVSDDVRLVGILMQKLVKLGVLLASAQQAPLVQVHLKRNDATSIELAVTASCSPMIKDMKDALFTPYYRELGTQTAMAFASGLEGYLVKTISDELQIPLAVAFPENSSQVRIQLLFSK